MPLTHQDNGVSMGRTLKDVSTQKKLLHFGGLKRPAKLVVDTGNKFHRDIYSVFQMGVCLSCIEIEVLIPTQPVTSNSASIFFFRSNSHSLLLWHLALT
jgi:hypothetical protein